MKALAWALALTVFLVFLGVYSFRLGIEPAFMHDDYEYTYPSFSLAERGNFGSPLLGTGFNVANRTYHFAVYYYTTVHAVLIRAFGDGPESIPLANTLHFALLAAAGAFFLVRRDAFLGVFVFLFELTNDERLVTAARQGRPEMTAGFCLTMGVLALWLWYGDGRRRPAVLFGMSTALTAGMFSHTAGVFLAAALLLAFAVPLAREARPRDVVGGLLPFAAIPLLYGYFILTDSITNIWRQLAPMRGNVILGRLLALVWNGQWRALAGVVAEFVHTNLSHPGLWVGVTACLALPAIAPHQLSRAARFFAGVYCLFLLVHLLFLKHFVVTYHAMYEPTLYLALAFLAEVTTARLGELWHKPQLTKVLRVTAIAVLVGLTVASVGRFRGRLQGQPLPYARLQGALVYALLESGGRPGDRVFVPSPFAFHLRRQFDVIAYPSIGQYFQGQWGPAFREGIRRVWGAEALRREDPRSLCWATGLAFIQPKWVVSWNEDYGVIKPLRDFLRRFPQLPGMALVETKRASLPSPYGGTVRVYRLTLSDAMRALERSPSATPAPCP